MRAGDVWELVLDLAAFVRYRRKYWLLPLVLVFVLFGAVIVGLPASPLSAFVYALF